MPKLLAYPLQKIYILLMIPQVLALVNVEVPGPHIRFEVSPPSAAIISQINSSLLLPCVASIKNVKVLEIYSWYRNGERITSGRRNDYQIFENGTLKVPSSERAAGRYRCIANGTETEVGAIISTESVVHYAVLKRFPSPTNKTGIIGQPLVLDCPIMSVPKANVTWLVGNKGVQSKIFGNRFFQIENGSLLISNVTHDDNGKFKCVAKNIYAVKEQRQFTWTISTIESNVLNGVKSHLIAVQNQTQQIPSGQSFKLHCVDSQSQNIEWSFRLRTAITSVKISNSSNEIFVEEASPEHDGFYECQTKTDVQVFNIIITTPPVIDHQLLSLESSLAAPVSFTCNATGNPAPNITWYRNGVKLINSYTVHYSPPVLRINSFDVDDEGVYQCFASNVAGEAVSYGWLSLRRKEDLVNMPKRPENVKCYPVNYKSVYVTFDSTPSLLFMMKINIVTESPFKWTAMLPMMLHSNSSLRLSGTLPSYKPFVLFMRRLVTTSTQSSNGNQEHTFDASLLSKGVKCATQGLDVHAKFLTNGVFISWSPIPFAAVVKYFILQFWHNDSSYSLTFENTINGTSHEIDLVETSSTIETYLVQIPVVTKKYDAIRERRSISNYPETQQSIENNDKPSDGVSGNLNIDGIVTEIKVLGNVTGVVVPRSSKLTVRVLVITDENENLDLDFQHVEWITIENITQYSFNFEIINIESRSILFAWNPMSDKNCIKVCYKSMNLESVIKRDQSNDCQEFRNIGMQFIVRKLRPSNTYRMELMDCKSHTSYGSRHVTTKPDAPGPVTNQKISKDNGLKLSWEPPVNPNGAIYFYNILWTNKNTTHEANVTANEKYFKFPNITENDKINVTVRAVGASGFGLPIFIDLRNIQIYLLENDKGSSDDPILGITLGVLLSVFCIAIFIFVFLRQRSRFKSRSRNQNRTSPSELNIPPQTPCNIELHEMQTLIPKPENITIKCDTESPPTIILPNGNGVHHQRSGSITEFSQDIDENSTALCTSTPKLERKCDPSEILLYENSLVPNLIPQIKDLHLIKLNKNSSSPNFSNNANKHSNGNATEYQNGSVKTILPPSFLKHSIPAASESKLVKANGNLKVADYPQYSTDPNSNTSIYDNSHQKLLDTTLDSSTINNCDDSDQLHNSLRNNDSNTTASTMIDLNDTKLSHSHNKYSNPLKNNWNYRRPIIDPNG